MELCEEQPNILSKAVVVDHTDAQNVFTALRFFGNPVEEFMHNKGHNVTANFICIVRNWFRACNEHGLKAMNGLNFYMTCTIFLQQE